MLALEAGFCRSPAARGKAARPNRPTKRLPVSARWRAAADLAAAPNNRGARSTSRTARGGARGYDRAPVQAATRPPNNRGNARVTCNARGGVASYGAARELRPLRGGHWNDESAGCDRGFEGVGTNTNGGGSGNGSLARPISHNGMAQER